MTHDDVSALADLVAPRPPTVFVMQEWVGKWWDVQYGPNGAPYYAISEELWNDMDRSRLQATGRGLKLELPDATVRYVRTRDVSVHIAPALYPWAPPRDPDAAVPTQAVTLTLQSARATTAAWRARPRDHTRLADEIDRLTPPRVFGTYFLMRRLSRWFRFLARRDEARARYATSLEG